MVDIQSLANVELVARDRLKATKERIDASLRHIAEGNPLAAEPDPARRLERLQAKADLTPGEARIVSSAIDMAAEGARRPRGAAPAAREPGPEAIQGDTLDFVGVAFLERGRRAADAVGRVALLNEAAQGTGFLVGPRLFLTNHHVIESAEDARQFQVQFDYEYDVHGRSRAVSSFLFDPDFCFVTDGIDGLDFTLIGVGERRSGTRALADFGFLSLSEARDKHMLGETANLIQHPDGRLKELVLRENRLVARDETQIALHYVADTEPGSSGSPVFNNEWEPIALHHWGGPWREVMGTDGQPLSREINEGIRISAIVRYLRDTRHPARSAPAVKEALARWAAKPRPNAGGGGATSRPLPEATRPDGPLSRLNEDGSVTWTFPIEISVRSPLLGSPSAPLPPAPIVEPAIVPRSPAPSSERAAAWTKEEFDDRAGYESGFIQGFVIPLPSLKKAKWKAAKNLLARPGEDEFELRYHHFSVVMNAERRLAYFTACNIDGSRVKAVVRDDKSVIEDPTLTDLGVESLGAEGAEASDDFRPDRRVSLDEQMTREFYEKQIVAGFPDPQSRDRIARIFQKGHIIMRGDPVWGTNEEAALAERDTFFYTNAAPQLGFFNQGSPLDRPGTKGKLRWRAVETYILRNAVTMRSRVTVFAGPIFDDDTDPPYRLGSKVPMRFWKVAAWNDGEALRSIALIADQRPLIEVMPEAMLSRPEAFGDEAELARVSEFLSTVEEIESLTGLDFGRPVREADIRAGGEPDAALRFEPQELAAGDRRSGRRRAARAARPAPARSRKLPRKR